MRTSSLVILAAVVIAGPRASAVPDSPGEGARRLNLVYTINNFGATIPMGCPHKILHDGGLPRRMTCLHQLAAAQGPLLLLDGGSAFFQDLDKAPDGEHDKLLLQAELIAESYNRMGYGALAVGSSDLLLGLDELLHLRARTRFPFLCANLELPAGPPFPPSVVLESGGVRVGVIGLLVDSIGKLYLERVAPGGKVLPAIPSARKAIEGLKGKVDLVVALSHVRMELNRDLARQVEGIDVIIDPSIEYANHHPHIRLEDWQELVGKTLVLRADGNGSALGVLEVDIRKPGGGMGSREREKDLAARETAGTSTPEERAELVDLRGRNLFSLRRLPLSPHYPDDLEGAALLETKEKGDDVSKVPALPVPAARDEYLTASACKDCHPKQYQNWLTATSHPRAYESIASGGWGRLPECVSCHVTGYGPGFVDPKDAPKYAGVQCEACHGTRPDHIKDPKTNPFSSVAESTCLPCHNEDVTSKDFSYQVALQKVRCPKGN